jgi:hypothetical protein
MTTRAPFKWPDETTRAADKAAADAVAADFFREKIRNLIRLPTPTAVLANNPEVVVATSTKGYVNCDVWVDSTADLTQSALLNAIVRLYAIVQDVRVLVATGTITGFTGQRAVSFSGRGVQYWEATVQLAANVMPPQQVNKAPFILVTYGVSAAGISNTSVLQLAGIDTSGPGVLQIAPSNASSVTIGAAGSTKLTIGNSFAAFAAGYALAFGPATAGTGYIRFPTGANQLMAFLTSGSANGNVLSTGAGDSLNLGDASGTNGATRVLGQNLFLSPTTGGVIHFQGNNLGVEWMNIDATAIHGTLPFAGDASSNKPFQLLGTGLTIPMAADANQTLTNTQYQQPVVAIVGGTVLTATRNIVLPRGGVFFVYNGSPGAQALQFIGATGTGITVANGKRAILYDDGTNYQRFTPDT